MSSISNSPSSAFTLKGSRESLLILRNKAKFYSIFKNTKELYANDRNALWKIYSVFKNMEYLSEKETNTLLSIGIFSSYHSLFKRMQYLSYKATNDNGKLSPEEHEEITNYFSVTNTALQYIYTKIDPRKNQSYLLNISANENLSSSSIDLGEGWDILTQSIEDCSSYIEKIRDEKSKKEKDEAEAIRKRCSIS